MIRIEVKSAAIREKNGTAKATGKPYAMKFQQVYVHGFFQDGFASDVPRATTIQMEENQQPYPVGLYAMSDESFYFGDFDKFTTGRMKLVPLGSWLAEANKQAQAMQPAPAAVRAAA